MTNTNERAHDKTVGVPLSALYNCCGVDRTPEQSRDCAFDKVRRKSWLRRQDRSRGNDKFNKSKFGFATYWATVWSASKGKLWQAWYRNSFRTRAIKKMPVISELYLPGSPGSVLLTIVLTRCSQLTLKISTSSQSSTIAQWSASRNGAGLHYLTTSMRLAFDSVKYYTIVNLANDRISLSNKTKSLLGILFFLRPSIQVQLLL